MEFWEWEPYYELILKDFGFDRRKDEEAAHLLSRLIPRGGASLSDLRRKMRDEVVTVLGNAPGLPSELHHSQGVIVAADEAVSVAVLNDVTPDVVVTDLDGKVEDLLTASDRGSITVIHAHGDNMVALERWVGQFSRRSLGTTQSRPFANIYNFGGFTDGDRAVFLADHFGAAEIRLLGFDFEKPNPKDEPAEVKARKLRWARKLIELLQKRRVILFPASSNSE